MPIPGYQPMMMPILRLAADGQVHTSTEAIELIARTFAVTDDERAQLLPSGRTRLLNNRVHWALTYLRHARLIEQVGRGQFQVAERGRSVLADPPAILDRTFLSRFPEVLEFMGASGSRETLISGAVEVSPQSLEEVFENAYRDLREEVERDLLDRLLSGTPAFFEKACLAVLIGMGYGGSNATASQHLGRPGDEGLDGVISEDALGLEKIYVQAKRYLNPVSQEQVRSFAGSLDGAHARKGVMITTSTFSPEAMRWVERVEKQLVLIEGKQLARFMVDYGVGVQRKATFALYRVDEDFFEPVG